MTTPDIDQSALELWYGATTIARYFDEDGDGAADSPIVGQYLALASATARDMLAPFPAAVVDLVVENERYQKWVATIALAERTMSKAEWMLPDGSFPYGAQMKLAKSEMNAVAKGHERLATNDANAMLQTVASPPRSTNSGIDSTPIFAKSREFPNGKGGF